MTSTTISTLPTSSCLLTDLPPVSDMSLFKLVVSEMPLGAGLILFIQAFSRRFLRVSGFLAHDDAADKKDAGYLAVMVLTLPLGSVANMLRRLALLNEEGAVVALNQEGEVMASEYQEYLTPMLNAWLMATLAYLVFGVTKIWKMARAEWGRRMEVLFA